MGIFALLIFIDFAEYIPIFFYHIIEASIKLIHYFKHVFQNLRMVFKAWTYRNSFLKTVIT